MRSYGEAVEVRTGDGTGSSGSSAGRSTGYPAPSGPPSPPAQFLWRGRLYVVRAVLAHWVELGTWWTGSPRSRRRDRPQPAGGPGPGRVPEEGEEPPRRSVAVDVGAVSREVWRVEAQAGRSSSIGVYDLVRDVPATPAQDTQEPGSAFPVPTRWRLARALD